MPSNDREYMARHERVYRERGRAADQVCVDCGNPAFDWSQRHETPGDDPADYDPRCRSCHARYDGYNENPTEETLQRRSASITEWHMSATPEEHAVQQRGLARGREGRPHTEETKARIAEGLRAYYQKKREASEGTDT